MKTIFKHLITFIYGVITGIIAWQTWLTILEYGNGWTHRWFKMLGKHLNEN